MKITEANRNTVENLIDNLIAARNALKSASALAVELGSGMRTTDVAGALDFQAFKLDLRACQYADKLEQLDEMIAAAKAGR